MNQEEVISNNQDAISCSQRIIEANTPYTFWEKTIIKLLLAILMK